MSSFFIKKLDILIMRIIKFQFIIVLILGVYYVNFYDLMKFTYGIF